MEKIRALSYKIDVRSIRREKVEAEDLRGILWFFNLPGI
ncbi:hypothetical protein ASZ90_017847 [hydrocarbon metagenome]|uniref:Uncharacterized protein n=1 Tax=hydrocarbon metagenome TaxID=938273 RepID=A0A0W8E7Y0_9ZZZZ